MPNEATRNTSGPRWPLILFLFGYTLAIRLIPYVLSRFGFQLNADITVYPWNFSPLLAVCLYGGAFFPRRSTAIWLPIALTFAGDAAIYLLTGKTEFVSIPISITVSLCAAACSFIGFGLREQRTWRQTIMAGLTGSIIFFLVTNFASWVCYDLAATPPRSLLQCYEAGLPFFRNTLISTAVYGGLLFGPVTARVTRNTSAMDLVTLSVDPLN